MRACAAKHIPCRTCGRQPEATQLVCPARGDAPSPPRWLTPRPPPPSRPCQSGHRTPHCPCWRLPRSHGSVHGEGRTDSYMSTQQLTRQHMTANTDMSHTRRNRIQTRTSGHERRQSVELLGRNALANQLVEQSGQHRRLGTHTTPRAHQCVPVSARKGASSWAAVLSLWGAAGHSRSPQARIER